MKNYNSMKNKFKREEKRANKEVKKLLKLVIKEYVKIETRDWFENMIKFKNQGILIVEILCLELSKLFPENTFEVEMEEHIYTPDAPCIIWHKKV